jgi:hypothetical protein
VCLCVCVCVRKRERERDVYFKRESEGDEIGGKLEQIGRPGGRRLGGVKCRTEVDTTRHTYKSWAQELRISRIDNVARAAGVLWIWNGSAGSLKPGLLLEVGRSGRSQSSDSVVKKKKKEMTFFLVLLSFYVPACDGCWG